MDVFMFLLAKAICVLLKNREFILSGLINLYIIEEDASILNRETPMFRNKNYIKNRKKMMTYLILAGLAL